MAAYDGSIRIDTSIDGKGFNSGIQKLTAGLGKMAAAVGVAFSLAAVVAFGKSSVDAASDLASALIGLQSVVEGTGGSFADAKAFIDDYISDGLVPATNAATAYKNLLARGYDTTQIEKVLVALKDAASFGRQSSLTLGQAVQSATEGLKNENSILVDNAGVTKNVSQMWKDYAASIGTTVNALTKEQKIQAEVAGILEETRFQTGDAAKLAGTYSGQVSALTASFTNLKVGIGNSIIPIVTRIMPYIRAAVDALVVFFNRVASFMSLLFGVDISPQATSMEGYAGSTQDAADATGDLANNTNKAAKAAKGALAAFDQLNVLQQDQGDAGAGAGAAGGVGGGIGLPETNAVDDALDGMKKKVEEFKTLLASSIEPLKRVGAVFSELGNTIWAGLGWVWEELLVPFGEWVAREIAPRFFDVLATTLEIVNIALQKAGPVLQRLWDDFLKPAASYVGDGIIKFLDWLNEGLNLTKDAIMRDKLWEEFFGGLQKGAVIAWMLVEMAWGRVAQWFKDTVIEPVRKFFADLWQAIKDKAAEAWAFVVRTWNGALAWFRTTVIDPVVNWFVTGFEKIKSTAAAIWGAVQSVWRSASDWFRSTVTEPLKNAFDTVLGNIKTAFSTVFEGIKSTVRGIINSIIDFINTMIQGIASGINTVVGGLNAISVKVPSWVPVYGGKSWGFSVPYVSANTIPRLAQGAVIPANAEFAAILGDQRNGTNIETPESLLRQIVSEEIGKIQGEFTFKFDGTLGALVRELKPRLDRESVRIGGSLIRSEAAI